MPPCSEEIDCYNDTLYVMFESAGEKYLEGTDGKGTSLSPIDKILEIHVDELNYQISKNTISSVPLPVSYWQGEKA